MDDILPKNDSQDDDGQNYGEDNKQATSLVPRALLIPARTAQLPICAYGIGRDPVDVLTDNVQLAALLMNNMCNISEELIQFANALLNIANFGLTLNDKRFLEVYFVLVGKSLLFFELLLLLFLLRHAFC